MIANDFKSINKILHRQEQKAEFEANNPKPEPSIYGWPYNVATPLTEVDFGLVIFDILI